MKNNSKALRISIFYLTWMLTLASCEVHRNHPPEIEVFESLNERVFSAIANNDTAGLKEMFSDNLQVAGENLLQLTNVANQFAFRTFRVLKEFQTESFGNGILTLRHDDSQYGYSMRMKSPNRKVAINLLVTNDENRELLILIVYGNFEGTWKIDVLQLGLYSIHKKNAVDYYRISKEAYNKGFLYDAIANIMLSKECLRPAKAYFYYDLDSEIYSFYRKVTKELEDKFHFPFVVEYVPSKPKIFQVYPEEVGSVFYPMICYKTAIPLQDTVRLKAEFTLINKGINGIFKGISTGKDFVFYKAFNEIPDNSQRVEYYGFIDTVNFKK